MGYEPKLVGYIDHVDRNVFLMEGKNTTTFVTRQLIHGNSPWIFLIVQKLEGKVMVIVEVTTDSNARRQWLMTYSPFQGNPEFG